MEEELTKKADVVFATSKYLFHLRKGQNPNTYYFPSGIDLEQFQKALSPAFKVNTELEDISHPIIGFVGGMVNSKMNWEWIHEVSVLRPLWNFVFIGPCAEPPPKYITVQKNITFISPKPPEALPFYIKDFDVCLIPYQGEAFLKACSPTKAFEYLAAGKPVVASWIPDLEDYQHVIRLSRNSTEFLQNIEAALADGQKSSMVQEYVRAAHGRTWEDRIEKTSRLIESLL
jgi:glycosyltransferase involved in cell wall biosynthesis